MSCCEGADLDQVVGENAVPAPGSGPGEGVENVHPQPSAALDLHPCEFARQRAGEARGRKGPTRSGA